MVKQMILNRNCTHKSAILKNCKYCPDCGEKIFHKWVTIKCRGCGHYRKPAYDIFKNLKPAKKYCFNCGCDKWNFQYYYESTIPDKMKLVSVKQIQTEQEYNERFKNPYQKTSVWVNKI